MARNGCNCYFFYFGMFFLLLEKEDPKSYLLKTIRLKTHHFHVKLPCRKSNKMGNTKWAYHKEQSVFCTCFIYLKFLFHFGNLLKRVDLISKQMSKFVLPVNVGVLFENDFSL